ncbi:RNA polymerase sigma factor [Streptomyces calvus]|uniref:RNA polymerase sigma factor n=1 Tax=Streptomyces calvus TaxID=67282 RepID=UPI001602E07D|nr:sigma-70 family RNA polymerase sigma factor [Streptomyces calvus]MBA8975752.1 RNA polymerase sigma factor (sigma-70 family) [Streptomyces calvus]
MATDMPAQAQAAQERWERMWGHREHLLKVARRRSMSQEDAEDAVHEAMLRAAERPDLDDERLGAWLTTVTMRLCVDRYRQVHREAEVRTSPTLVAPGPVPVEEAVCDRAEARWLAVRSGELPARQAEALRLKSLDLDVGQVAVHMGLSYRTVESLLARARRTLRNSLAGTLGLALFLCGRGRPRTGGKAQAVAVASTAATLAVAGFVVPHTLDDGGSGSTPRSSSSQDAEAPATGGTAAPSHPAARPDRTPAPGEAGPEATGAPADGSLLTSVLPVLPEVSELARTEVPPVPEVPEVGGVPGLPELPGVPDLPAGSAGASMPSAPALPSAPPLPSADVPEPGQDSAPLPGAPSVPLP